MGDSIFTPAKRDDVLIEYVKEKEHLRTELKGKDIEIKQLRSRIYDLTQKLDDQKKLKNKNKENNVFSTTNSFLPLAGSGTPRPTTGKGPRTPAMKRVKTARRKKTRLGSKLENGEAARDLRIDMTKYTDVPELISHYLEVAQKFPDIKLPVLMEAEKQFYESDTNNDGFIDEEEMEKVLTKQNHLFTNAQLKQIMSEVDIDNNNSIDLMEYLAIVVKIQERKRVDLPSQLTKSSLCSIQ